MSAVFVNIPAPAVVADRKTAPPTSPGPGDAFIVKATASGAFAGKEGYIARYNGSGWDFIDARDGSTTWVQAEALLYTLTSHLTWDVGAADVGALPTTGGTMSGAIAMGTHKITGLDTPTVSTDAATKAYADLMLPLAGGTMAAGSAINVLPTAGSPTFLTSPATNWTYGVPLVHLASQFDLGNSIIDPVYYMGWNFASGGAVAVAGKQAVGIGFEGHAARNDDATKAQTEWHAVMSDTAGNLYRFISANLFADGTNLATAIGGDTVTVNDKAGLNIAIFNTAGGLRLRKADSSLNMTDHAGAEVAALSFSASVGKLIQLGQTDTSVDTWNTFRNKGVYQVYDGSQTYPAGMATSGDATHVLFGINQDDFGTKVAGAAGAYLDIASQDQTFGFYYKPASAANAQVAGITRYGGMDLASAVGIAGGGNAAYALRFHTSTIGLYVGSGAASLSAGQGSVYMRSNGRPQYNTDGAGTWKNIVTEDVAAVFASSVTVGTGFGCNGASAKTAVASGGALAAYGAGINGFDTAGNASALYAMVVAIRGALVANGIMS